MEPKDVFTCRGVRREHGFDDAASAIFGDVRKSDEALTGIEFALARHPEHGQLVAIEGRATIYVIRTRESAIGPAVCVYYWIDAQNVHFAQETSADRACIRAP